MEIVAELKFEKLREIGVGQGLNSTVYLARDSQLNSELAIKQIDKSVFWNPNYFAEAEAVQAVSHPNVVSVHYGCETPEFAYVAMPFYPHGSLASQLAGGVPSLSSFLRLGHDILHGIAHVHARGYLHLDLKPSNILIGDNLKPLIADFGQARFIEPSGLVTAPPIYCKSAPPEVLLTGRATIHSDIFQLGILFYRVLNGEKYFDEQLARYSTPPELQCAIKTGKFPDRGFFLPHVSDRLRRIVRKALKVNPVERFESATSMADALSKVSIDRDWMVEMTADDEHRWTSTSPNKPRVCLKLSQDISGGWRTEVHTVGKTSRVKRKEEFWKVASTKAAAFRHLESVFADL